MTASSILESPWTIMLGVVVAAFVVARLLVTLLRPLLGRLVRRSEARWDDVLVEAVATPVSLLIALQAVRASLPWLGLDLLLVDQIGGVSAVVTSALVMWIGFRMVDLVVHVLCDRPWAKERPSTRSLLAISGRVVKVVLVVLAGIVVLAQLGVSVASLIAGLGIGGLALALAAQKTVENLFGTMSIAVDQPMREGDFVRAGEHLGTIESIGLRSTRIRTLDRTIVTVPNGKLADERVESYTARDRLRLYTTLAVNRGATSAQLRDVLADVEAALREHPLIWPDAVVVRFVTIGPSSFDIEVMAWFLLTDWNEFTALRQELYLRFLEIVETRAGGFAFPTQVMRLAPGEPAPAPRPEKR